MKHLKKLTIFTGIIAVILGIFIHLGAHAEGISVTLEEQISTDSTKIRYISTISEVGDLDKIQEIHVLLTETKDGKSRDASYTLNTVYEAVAGENGKEAKENTYYAVYTVSDVNTHYGCTLSCAFEYLFTDSTTLTTNTKTYEIPNNVISEVINTSKVKVNYSLGEAFSLSGITVTLGYEDGSHKILGSEGVTCDTSSINTGEEGEYTVSITGNAGIASTELKVTYTDNAIVSLEASSISTQSVYQGGTYVPDSGVTVTAIYSDGTKKCVTADAIYTTDTSAAGDVNCTVSYEGQTASIPVTVKTVSAASGTYLLDCSASGTNSTGDVTSLFTVTDSTETAVTGKFTISAEQNSSSTQPYFSDYIRLYGGSVNGGKLTITPVSGEISAVTYTVKANKNDVTYTINGTAKTASTSNSSTETITYDTPVSSLVIQDTATTNARLDIISIRITLGSGSDTSHTHTWVKSEGVNPTCEASGYITYECSSCHQDLTVTLEATGHSYNGNICEYCKNQVFVAPEGYFTSEERTLYTVSDINPYGVDLTKYGSDTEAVFYDINTLSAVADPYESVTSEDFYSDYKVSTTYEDTYYRSLHGLVSGTLDNSVYDPEETTITSGGTAVRCSTGVYVLTPSGDYVGYIVNSKTPFVVFYGGAYIGIEEVAAYLLAFGEVPANNNYDKSSGKSASLAKWGDYARVNVDDFSGSTSSYPFEPVLTDISGCGGSLKYTETDFGSQGGFDCSGTVKAYVTGTTINRGVCRFVFVNMKNNIYDINARHVFYTCNHYNDFREYLNYEGGWSAKFGNESAGNPYCSGASAWKSTYNDPTSVPEYVSVTLADLYA